MINLREYREYWEKMAARIDELTAALPATADEEIGKKLQKMKSGETILFYMPPTGEGKGPDIDSYRDDSLCVIFIMRKYDAQKEDAYETLEKSQPVIEEIKALMLSDMAAGCPVMKIDHRSLSTLPETGFYRSMAGWSLGFKII